GTLTALDSTFTDNAGNYTFCNVNDSVVFIKAAPDSAAYPTEMPTYSDSTLFWNNALPYVGLSGFNYTVNFATLFGQNPGGPGFVGGLVSQGANKTDGPGDPVPDVRLYLVDDNTGQIIGTTVTDANGYFSFGNLPLGDYAVVPDVPNVDVVNVPVVSLTALTPSLDSLDFRLHSTYFELALGTGNTTIAPSPNFAFEVAPNPFHGETSISLTLDADTELRIRVFNALGESVLDLAQGNFRAGSHDFNLGSETAPLPQGVYFVRLEMAGLVRTLKVLNLD
ncbi:MAG: carboxypeptidase regulatory-like domain-containing protein, partial [Bacteroidota bacterium]